MQVKSDWCRFLDVYKVLPDFQQKAIVRGITFE